ncbi:Ser/Thr phosphatase [Nitritalea halalkaliphila LW7]|uniref:Ser/Thr phosphatase n=1 Tax=Nitritalea halalkaliphila LW7 TaxID=1189621 RepID=I5C1P8_9BACT|nr:PP2C family protein-serine/threonine phosphatase [Nitritalea halalkaliphila]EIM75750.1 Ser/Thr phosphatase [Nitritalea halalkaliphila LW7]
MISESLKYQRKELELKSLLEITQAINENKTAEVLLHIFKFTCLVHLNIRSLVLYGKEAASFTKLISHGLSGTVPSRLAEKQISHDREQGQLNIEVGEEQSFEELELFVPVYHKQELLAILLLKRKDANAPIDLDFTKALTNILVVALENKRFAKRQLEQERLRKEVEIASSVQRMLFPEVLPYTETLRAMVTYYPHSTVGGDYYDLIWPEPQTVYFCVADVSGKGMPAALLMSNFQAALRTLLRSFTDMRQIVEQLNATAYDSTKGERFITFFLGRFSFSDRELTFVNAGHNPPLLSIPSTGSCEELSAGTTILGAFESLPFLEIGTRRVPESFHLHLYTDGLTEVLNPAEEEFGEERFHAFVREMCRLEPKDFHTRFLEVLNAFSAGTPRRDDLTLLSVELPA